METVKMRTGQIERSWSAPARRKNFRNFRFYPILIFGLVCTLGPVAFVIAVMTRLAMGYSTGTAGAPAILLLFAIAALIFYFGQKALRLKDGSGPFYIAFVFGILGCAITFGERAGADPMESAVLGPAILALAVISLFAGAWLIEPRRPGTPT